MVYIVKISRANELASVHPLYSGSNPFVEMKLVPQDIHFGEQLQKTSYKPLTTNPEWTPHERFMFYVSSNNNNKTTNQEEKNNAPQIQFTM